MVACPAMTERKDEQASFWPLLRLFLHHLREDEVSRNAAALAYYCMLSLFPALILLVALLDALPLQAPLQRLSRDISAALPQPAAELINGYLIEFSQRKPSGLVSLWALALLWSSSRGLAGARVSLNRIFGGRERRPAWLLRCVAAGMTFLTLLLVGGSYMLLLGGPQLGAVLARGAGLGHEARSIWNLVRWPLVVLFLTAFVMLAYRYLPAKRTQYRHLLAGAVPCVLGWIALGMALRLWLSQWMRLDQVYGSLASVILLLVLLWAFSLLFLFGGEVAAHSVRVHERAQP
ncbi:MAG: YihY/virulence factor BrkB family protein [Planctomycetota bacterium]|nr:MAG: YihY/virulence factor BrkB family protein [Planctomycetota bacterium]